MLEGSSAREGGRGLKLIIARTCNAIESSAREGGRGLKPKLTALFAIVQVRSSAREGGRGLKRMRSDHQQKRNDRPLARADAD